MKCHVSSRHWIPIAWCIMRVFSGIADIRTLLTWRVRCTHMQRILKNSWRNIRTSHLSAVNIRMPWEIPVVQCINTRICQTVTPDIKGDLSGITLTSPFTKRIVTENTFRLMAEILTIAQAITSSVGTALCMGETEHLLRKCRK